MFRPLIVIWAYWVSVIVMEHDAEFLPPVYIEIGGT